MNEDDILALSGKKPKQKNLFIRLFCSHNYVKPVLQKNRGNGMFGFLREHEFRCKKCGNIKYSDYEDVPPFP